VRFADLLRATVLLSGAATTALAIVTFLAAQQEGAPEVVVIACGWWAVAAVIGARLGRSAEATPPIARALADARRADQLPEPRPAATMVNRLWPLLLVVLLAGGLALLVPQVPAVTTGFTLIWALAWRRQDRAVTAIEERDGVAFFVERTSPFRAIRLVRTHGLRREAPALP
jgi:hypothetical protein